MSLQPHYPLPPFPSCRALSPTPPQHPLTHFIIDLHVPTNARSITIDLEEPGTSAIMFLEENLWEFQV